MKFITITLCTLLWICTLCAIDISVDFSDGSRFVCEGWLRKLMRR